MIGQQEIYKGKNGLKPRPAKGKDFATSFGPSGDPDEVQDSFNDSEIRSQMECYVNDKMFST